MTFWIKEGSAILTRFREPAEVASALERDAGVIPDDGQRYTGYAVLGVAFESGDVLALRRFPLTSDGRDYTSVWHCSPEGRWTLYTDVAAHGCAQYFGPAVDEVIVAPIRVEWTGPRSASIAIDGGRRLIWSLLMRSSALTRACSAWAAVATPTLLKYPRLLTATASGASVLLRLGRLRLSGDTPSGERFLGCPWGVWLVRSSRACVRGRDTGPEKILERRLALGDFVIPRRGVFAAAHVLMLPRTPVRGEQRVTSRAGCARMNETRGRCTPRPDATCNAFRNLGALAFAASDLLNGFLRHRSG